jgi:hypothetical protein
MQSVKPLLLVLLTFSLLSCETTKPATTIIGAEKTSKCGELPAGVTIDRREFRLAGAKLGEFSLGEAVINSTPEFTQILSEASKNKVVQGVLTCNAIELAGVSHDAEMVAYFIEMQDFLSTNPSVDDRIKWKKAFPFPKAAPQEQSTPRESSEIRFAKSCKQPVDGLRRQPESFVPIWLDILRVLYKEKFPPDRDLLNLYSIKDRYRDPYHTPDDFFRESLYTLKCLEDTGEMKLEKLGTTSTYGGKAFDNQRIIFKSQ